MKLLFDANLSHRLVDSLSDRYPGSTHVRRIDLEEASDSAVWRYARENGFTIVTKNGDFRQMSFVRGAPPKVVWIRIGNCTTSEVARILRSRREDLTRFEKDEESAYLALD